VRMSGTPLGLSYCVHTPNVTSLLIFGTISQDCSDVLDYIYTNNPVVYQD